MVLLALAGLAGELRAQNQISVPLTNGFIGTRASSAGTANNVLTFGTLGIARIFFIQNSSTNQFELQGNDIPGTLRIVRASGTTLDIPASANWRNSGGTTFLIGILPRPGSPITFTYAGGSIQITDGSVPGGSSVGGYVAAYTGAVLADGASTSGNAAQTQVLTELNAYLATVVSSRPSGPVTVNTLSTTTSTTPTITGTATLAAGENLSVVVDGVQYTTSSTPAVVQGGAGWSLTLASPLAVGTYSVTATITDADGFTLSDATADELVIQEQRQLLTIGGSFTAHDRPYDGTVAATGTTNGLSLVGVLAPDAVTIASVTLAFDSAAVASGRTVTLTGVTLGGADAARYTVSLAGAPTATASITARPLTIAGVTASDRAYDGTTAATLGGTAAYAGLASGESFGIAGTPTASFATADVGTGKAVMVTGYAPPSANYTVTQPTGLTASITPRPLTIGGTFAVADKVHDGTTTATITSNALSLVGVVDDEDVALSGVTAAFTDAAAGAAKPVTLAAASLTGAAAGNYALSLAGAPVTTASITTAGGTVTIGGSFTAHDRPYDGTTTATGTTSGLTLVGATASDDVTIASVTLAFDSAAVGSGRTVVVAGVTLGGADAGEWEVSLAGAPTATASITPRPLTIGGSFAAADKVFDGTTAATITTSGLALVGIVVGDTVALAGVTAAFADSAVGPDKPVALSAASLAGADAGNYTLGLAGAPTTTASITDAAPPSAPRDVAATPADGSITLTWAAPATAGCAAVGGYVVDYSTDEGQSWTRVTLATSSPTATQLQGLVNNVAHRVRVAAVNACGTGAFSATVGPVVPVGPIVDGSGRPASSSPGAAATTTGGVTQPVTPEIVQDTIVRLVAGEYTLRLIAGDQHGVATPVEPSRALELEHGGRVAVDGSGFDPGSFVTVYLYTATGEPLLLGSVEVGSDGRFAAAPPIPGNLPVGAYTLQVNGIDPIAGPRSVGLGMEIVPPPADLVLTSTPDRSSPMVGDTITITLTVTNQGPGPAIDVGIPRAFNEPGFTVVRTTPHQGTYDETTQTWTIGRIEPGAHARMLLTVVVRPPADSQGSTP